ncbi:hypothetical protein BES34_021080 [Leptospira inadai serovar Lyme]|uniref:Uncharacterized protein n=1 Tax=Leptospira inadai serovar Lyme TaxID=293084 RepID=A0ABX4YCR4_9LEPT|nr:hypothetical protein BES34_021080 [Leptospira inadai serovar Lyme]
MRSFSEDRGQKTDAFVFRGQRSEDRCVRFAHARQKLHDVGKVIEVEERSNITQEFSFRTWKFRSLMFCPLQKTVAATSW